MQQFIVILTPRAKKIGLNWNYSMNTMWGKPQTHNEHDDISPRDTKTKAIWINLRNCDKQCIGMEQFVLIVLGLLST